MSKVQVAKAKPVIKKIARPRRQPLVAVEPEATAAFGAMEVATDWRFHLATLTRISDNLVTRAVHAYDRLFGLDAREASEIYFEVAEKLIEGEKIEEAISVLRKVLRAKPDHAQALFELGAIHMRQGASIAAITMLQRAKAAGMSDRKLHMLLADAFGREERFDEALTELDTAVTMKPELADTHYRRALLLDRLERHVEAVMAFESAIALAPMEIRYHQSLGFTLETMGRRADAIQCFKRALDVERSRDRQPARARD